MLEIKTKENYLFVLSKIAKKCILSYQTWKYISELIIWNQEYLNVNMKVVLVVFYTKNL